MIHIKDTRKIQLNSDIKTAVALGKFDGLHEGHMLLIRRVLELQKKGCTGVMFTFDMRENSVFDAAGMKTIYTPAEKKKVAGDTGIDMMVEYPFDDSFAQMKPEAFVRDVLVGMLRVSYVVVGSDFRFGRDRSGDVDTLKSLAEIYGYEVCVIDKLQLGEGGALSGVSGGVVSSTAIRGLIASGDVRAVIPMLGRPYSMSGVVVKGRQLGRTIGIPTANILPAYGKLYPANGVYASRVRIEGMAGGVQRDPYRVYSSITNIGDNPTVNDKGNITIETHIFDFDEDIYGAEICVELIERVRGERRFEGIHELEGQMRADIDRAGDILRRMNEGRN